MIKHLVLLILILAFSLSATAKPITVYQIKDEDIAQAAKHFEEGEYSKAQSMYLDLASAGDKYAQYILSIIELQGLVEEPNLIKAYAWAKVAKEGNKGVLKAHFERLSELIADPDEEKILSVSSAIYSKYSNMAVAKRYLRHMRKELPKCTGSRIRGNVLACERIQVSCDRMRFTPSSMEACLDFVAKIQPDNLERMKKDLKLLKTYIEDLEQNSGSVIVTDESNK